jgi:hypothetical protein
MGGSRAVWAVPSLKLLSEKRFLLERGLRFRNLVFCGHDLIFLESIFTD